MLGLLPGPVAMAGRPGAARADRRRRWKDRAGLLDDRTDVEAPGYAAIAIALLLASLPARRSSGRAALDCGGHPARPAWACGFAPPPPWLPFGDPATQYGGASFAQPLRRSLGGALLAAREARRPASARRYRARRGSTVAAHDPADTLAVPADAAGARAAMPSQADRMQFLTIRRTLAVMFAVLVLFLAVIALAGGERLERCCPRPASSRKFCTSR